MGANPKNPRLLVTLPKGLKTLVENEAVRQNCSQAEIVKAALYRYLEKIDKGDAKNGN